MVLVSQVFLSVFCSLFCAVKLLLPSQLSERQLYLDGRQLFVNVYAMNNSVNLSSAYPHRAFPSIPLCSERQPATRVWVKLRPVTYTVHWSRSIIFDWPKNSRHIALYLQPCRRPQNQEFLYTLQVFQQ